jgi:hypothetical protein
MEWTVLIAIGLFVGALALGGYAMSPGAEEQ